MYEAQTILWLDDKLEIAHRVLVEALEEAGFDVEPAVTVDLALDALAERAFDVVLVDLRIPDNERDGFEVLDALGDRRLVDGFEMPRVIACSAHLDQDAYRRELAKYNYPIFVLDKGLINAPEVDSGPDRFVALVTGALDDPDWQSPKQFLDSVRSELLEEGPFEIPLSRFNLLTDAQQSILLAEGFGKAQERLRELSRRRSRTSWALFCGSAKKPVKKGPQEETPPTDREIEDLSKGLERVPFFVSFNDPLIVEEVKLDCRGALTDYPRVDLRVGRATSTVSAHFDTGSDGHFLRKADLIDGEVSVSGLWKSKVDDASAGFYLYLFLEPFQGSLFVRGDQQGERMDVDVVGAVAIDGWDKCKFSRECENADDSVCSVDGAPVKDGVCQAREALLGRRLLGDNDLEVTVRGGSSDMDVRRLET